MRHGATPEKRPYYTAGPWGVAEGVHTKEIASRLGVSVKTVLAHRRPTMDKLGLDSMAELVKYAVREGLTSLGD